MPWISGMNYVSILLYHPVNTAQHVALLVSQHGYHRLGAPHPILWLRTMKLQTDLSFIYPILIS